MPAGHIGLDVAQAPHAAEVDGLEPAIGVDVGGDNPQQRVAIAQHQITFKHFEQFEHPGDEILPPRSADLAAAGLR